tara:strand:+ start:19785 stop:20219 length:435 start_codon:yes stop_codon:yes gene_type:complete
MLFISHRGNIDGPLRTLENNPSHILTLTKRGIDVEIDVWYDGEQLYLGHDKPRYEIDLSFLQNDKFWCHAKNLQALEYMLQHNVHCFWHQTDDYTITSRGYIWTFPNKPVCKKSIIVCHSLEETKHYANLDIAGVCSDYIGEIK